jgi:hypothetical protein
MTEKANTPLNARQALVVYRDFLANLNEPKNEVERTERNLIEEFLQALSQNPAMLLPPSNLEHLHELQGTAAQVRAYKFLKNNDLEQLFYASSVVFRLEKLDGEPITQFVIMGEHIASAQIALTTALREALIVRKQSLESGIAEVIKSLGP